MFTCSFIFIMQFEIITPTLISMGYISLFYRILIRTKQIQKHWTDDYSDFMPVLSPRTIVTIWIVIFTSYCFCLMNRHVLCKEQFWTIANIRMSTNMTWVHIKIQLCMEYYCKKFFINFVYLEEPYMVHLWN